MNTTISKWMSLAATVIVIAALVWNVLIGEMSLIADGIAQLMGGETTP